MLRISNCKLVRYYFKKNFFKLIVFFHDKQKNASFEHSNHFI